MESLASWYTSLGGTLKEYRRAKRFIRALDRADLVELLRISTEDTDLDRLERLWTVLEGHPPAPAAVLEACVDPEMDLDHPLCGFLAAFPAGLPRAPLSVVAARMVRHRTAHVRSAGYVILGSLGQLGLLRALAQIEVDPEASQTLSELLET